MSCSLFTIFLKIFPPVFFQLVWIETPTNPLMSIVDIKAVADTVHQNPGTLLVVDNTFFTCYNQVQHLRLGVIFKLSPQSTLYFNSSFKQKALS